MKRSLFIAVVVMVLIIINIISMQATRTNINDSNTLTYNWKLNVNSSTQNISKNQVKLLLNYTVSFLTDINIPVRITGGNYFRINSTNFYWIPYTASQVTEYNVFQPKGTFQYFYSVLFNKSNNYYSYYTGGNDYTMNYNKTGTFTLILNFYRELNPYIGVLNLNMETEVNITLNPVNWEATGYIASALNSTSGKTNSNLTTLTTDSLFSGMDLLTGVICLGLLIIIRQSKKKLGNNK